MKFVQDHEALSTPGPNMDMRERAEPTRRLQISLPANINAPVSSRAASSGTTPLRSSRKWYLSGGKRLFETALIILTVPLWAPLMLLCAFALWLEGGQPF